MTNIVDHRALLSERVTYYQACAHEYSDRPTPPSPLSVLVAFHGPPDWPAIKES